MIQMIRDLARSRFEEDLIDARARTVTRNLYTSIEPIPYEVFASGIRQLAKAGLISAERLPQILARVVVD